jgi:hypothetical protein
MANPDRSVDAPDIRDWRADPDGLTPGRLCLIVSSAYLALAIIVGLIIFENTHQPLANAGGTVSHGAAPVTTGQGG